PGIMTFDGVLRLARLYGVRAGQRAVVLSSSSDSSDLLEQLRSFGIEVVGALGSSIHPPPFPSLRHSSVIQARGHKHLKTVRRVDVNEEGKVIQLPARDEQGRAVTLQREWACDLLCLATESVPANELLLQGGMRFKYEHCRWKPSKSIPGLL